MMQEKTFRDLTKEVYQRIFDALDDFDPDEVEAELNLDNVSITFRDGVKFIVNQQPPVRQIWLATKNQGLHFDYVNGQWVCKKTGQEFFTTLSKEISSKIGMDVLV